MIGLILLAVFGALCLWGMFRLARAAKIRDDEERCGW